MLSATEIQEALTHFHGSETVHTLEMYDPKVIFFTEGVQYLQDSADCFWLINAIASHQSQIFPPANNFQVWHLVVDGTAALLTCEDGNGNQLARQEIRNTDFPLPEIKIWVTTRDRIFLLLPSEY
ncbi:DUF6876 family protein [Chamaesiphon sp.]|uniref:DUF6876 family protein n=1 Tax=Chamaesiphon sp. TaxID=2814140 RepID=UPI003593E7AB